MPETEHNCLTDVPCSVGEVCVEGECRAADCTDSSVCAFGERCDVAAFTCVPGCERDEDCLASDECAGEECVPRECTDTHRHCPLFTTCEDGDCAEAPPSTWCQSCETNAECPTDWGCVLFDLDDPEGSWCVSPCETTADCPSGFTCLEDVEIGGFIRDICYADCLLLRDNGLLE